jgi:hypothetical protein
LQIGALGEATRLRSGADGDTDIDALSELAVLADVALLAAVAAVLRVGLQIDAIVVAARLAAPTRLPLLLGLLFLLLTFGVDPGQPRQGEGTSEGESAQESSDTAAGPGFTEGTDKSVEMTIVHGVVLPGMDSPKAASHLQQRESMTKNHYPGPSRTMRERRSGHSSPCRLALA